MRRKNRAKEDEEETHGALARNARLFVWKVVWFVY